MLVALDLETACNVEGCPDYGKSLCRNDHSLSPWHGHITAMSFYAPKGPQGVRHSSKEIAATLAELRGSQATLLGHNFKFDALWLSVHHPEFKDYVRDAWVADTNLAAFVHTEKVTDTYIEQYQVEAPQGIRKAGKHSLKVLAPYYLGVEPYWETLGHDSDEYAFKDAKYTFELHRHLESVLTKDERAFYCEKLLPWAKMCLEAELAGLRLDIAGLQQYKEELATRERQLRKELDRRWQEAHTAYRDIQTAAVNRKYDAQKPTKSREPRRQVALMRVPSGVDYNSPAQMRWLLSDFYGYDIHSLEGDETTGKEVLNRLADEGRDDVKLYLEWRKTQKVLTAFIPGLLEHADSLDRVHPIYNITGTKTGRLSCERFNAQQVPKELKRFFKPDEGEVIIGYDAKAIEAKLIGVYTDDSNICDIVLSGKSFHDFNAKAFFSLECDVNEVSKLYPKERRAAKTIGFAGLYGAGPNRIRVSFTQAGFPISVSEAKSIHTNYREAYAKAFEVAREFVESFESGEVINNLLGRPLHFQNPDDCYMQAFNRLIQSSASDYNMQAAYLTVRKLRQLGIDARVRLLVHDYIGISVPADRAEEADRVAQESLAFLTLTTSYGKIKLDYEGGISEAWE